MLARLTLSALFRNKLTLNLWRKEKELVFVKMIFPTGKVFVGAKTTRRTLPSPHPAHEACLVTFRRWHLRIIFSGNLRRWRWSSWWWWWWRGQKGDAIFKGTSSLIVLEDGTRSRSAFIVTRKKKSFSVIYLHRLIFAPESWLRSCSSFH